MTHSNPNVVETPQAIETDPLTSLIRNGARELIAQAVEAELHTLLQQHQNNTLDDGRQAVVRNGYLPKRTIQTGIGDIEVQVPKVRDRSGSGIYFNSTLLPPYLKRSKSVEELIPWLYLKGISTGDYQEALSALLGDQAKGLSAKSISRLTEQWQAEHQQWCQRDLSGKDYVYLWADGIYSNVRMDTDKLCLLVIIGVTAGGKKELIAIEDGVRESEHSWTQVLSKLKQSGLTCPPKLAIADGALGFWKALTKQYPSTRHQRCWVHKTANILNALPKSIQPKVKSDLHQIWMAPSKAKAQKALIQTVQIYSAKYPKAMEKLEKDQDILLTFYDFPAEHWQHIRTSNPIESMFSTIRLRTVKCRNCGKRETVLAMVFKLAQSAQKNWRRIKGFEKLKLLIDGIRFIDGVQQIDKQVAA